MSTVEENQEVVRKLMAEGEAGRKAALIQQGNKAQIIVPIDYVADSGTHYEGTLVFRRPSPMDYIRIGSVKAKLFASFGVTPVVDPQSGIESMAHVDFGVKRLASALATNQVLLIEPIPDWFKDYPSILDADLIFQVFDQFEEGLHSFRRPPEDKPVGDSEAGADKEAVDGEEAVRG